MKAGMRNAAWRLALSGMAVLVPCSSVLAEQAADAPREVQRTETDFAQAFAREGWKSFADFAAADALVATEEGEFVSARAYYGELAHKAGGPPRRSLKWQPSFVETDCAGQLGWSTGPVIRQTATDPQYSHYVTIWRRAEDGRWLWLFDRGVRHDEPDATPAGTPPQFMPHHLCPPARHGDAALQKRDFLAAVEEFRALALADNGAAYRRWLARESRVHRPGHPPYIGHDVGVAAGAADGPQRFETIGQLVSTSGDLAYSYGKVAVRKTGGEDHYLYLQIWRKEGSRWKIALDQRNPVRITAGNVD